MSAASPDHSDQDETNQAAFQESWDIIKLACTEDTFSYDSRFWKIPPPDTPWQIPTTLNWGQGAVPGEPLKEIGITPKPFQKPYPDIYAPFTFSATTARFWAREGGTPVVLSDNVEFCQSLFQAYRQ